MGGYTKQKPNGIRLQTVIGAVRRNIRIQPPETPVSKFAVKVVAAVAKTRCTLE